MNHIYRLCWNRTLRAWVPASELAKSKGTGASRSGSMARAPLMLSLLSLSMGMSSLAWAGNTPTGGQIVGGSGSIAQSGNVTTVQQNSQTLSLNWQSFDIGTNQTVDFLQPGSSSIAVNRILGNTASDIEGHLNANGQVWLINPNGVLFGKDAQVNVGGIVASTLDLDQSTLGTGTVRFSGNGKGSVVNLGTITVTPGGYAALLGNTVSNQGTIRAQLGTVALAGGTAMTLTFADNRLVHLVVNANSVQSLVENRQLIVADGGQVLMTAGARNSLIDSVVNNTGTVQAQTVQDHNGTITLLGGMEAGTVNVAGTLDASALQGGKGGFIETSGAHAHIADGSVITTKAAGNGQSGTWLVDPADFTIAASGGDITATQLATNLASGNVTLTSAQGTVNTSGSGNVNVNQAVTWGANTTLTLTASNNVNLNAAITNTGASGKTVLNATNAFVNNVGAAGLKGNWAIYSASPTATGEKLNGLTPGFIQYNAPIGTAAAGGATGNGLFYASAASINITGLANASKSYDGTSNLLVSQLSDTLSGGGNGDTLTAITGGYSQSDVGTGLKITAPTASSAYAIVNSGVPVYGYTVSGASSANSSAGAITAAQLYATIVGDPTKVYDGTTTATLTSSNYYISGLAVGQSVTVNQPSSVGYASADVNTNGGTTPNGGLVAVNASFASTNFVAGSGTKLSNYILPTATSTTAAALAADSTAGYGTITAAPVYLSGVQSTNKTYDATTNDPLNISNASIYGVVNGDNVTLDTSGATGNFASPNAGNNLAVTLSGFALTGSNATKVADYALIAPTDLTADIYQKALTVAGVTATDKVYDGTTTDTLGTGNAVLSGFVNAADQASTTLTTSSATGAFSQADVGNALAVTVNGLTVNNSNYSVTQPTGLTANITPASLTIAFSGSANKIYDGTNYATLSTPNFTVSGAVAGQTVTVNQAPAVYTGADAPNVGTDTVTATLQSSDLTFASGAKAGNYTFNTSVVGSGSITPAPLTIAINDNPTRTFDGTGDTSASLTAGNFVLSGVIPGQTINLGGSFAGNYYDTSNAAAPGAASYEGNAGTWGVVAALTGANFSAGSSTSLSNYQLPTTALGYGTILPKALGVSIVAGITGASKTYDGNTSLTLTPGNFNLSGFVNGDSATVNQNIPGTFATKNVGSQPITATLQESDFNFTGSDEGNYTFPVTAYGTGAINPATLTVSIIGNPTKTYDGNTTVLPLTGGTQLGTAACPTATCNFQVAGFVNGEGATINPTASFTYATANVARDSNGNVVVGTDAITGSLTQNNYTANNGTLLSNYTLDYAPTGNGTINPASLYVNGVYAQNKIYDGGTGALVNISNGQLAGLADVDKNAGDITLSIGNSSSSTADGIGSSTGGTITPNSNGSFSATGSPVGGTFASANAGNGQGVTTTFSLGGSSAGNYTLEPLTFTANITPRPLSVTGISANNKAYDGTTAATFTFTTPTFSQAGGTGSSVNGLLSQDASNVSLNQGSGTGTFATPNANTNPSGALLSTNGQPITVTANGFTLNGSAASNYVLSQPTGLAADIAQAQITANLTGSITKVYDGTSTITIPAADYSTSGWVAGQGGTITQTQSGYYGDPGSPQSNAGTYDVTANLVSSDWKPNAGTSLSNYALPLQVVGNMIGTIAPLALNLSATRVYDATTDIYSSISGNITNADNANVFGTLNGINGDQFTVMGQGAASNKNVGTYTGANFTLGSLALQASSGNANNYTLVGGVDTYTITKAPLDVTGATVATKVYDGTTTASVDGATLTQGNVKGDVLGSDVVTIGSSNIAGTFSDKNAGNGKTVNIAPSDIGGSDAGNYQLVQPANLTGDITQRPVTIGGSRQYDGTDTAVGGSGATWQNPGAVSGNASSGVVSGDTVKVNGGSGSVALADVGTYNSDGSGAGTFDATGLTLSNANYAIASTGNSFQITPMVLTLSGTRVYDGTANADADLVTSLNGSSSGISDCGADCVTLTGANGENLNLAGIGTGALSSANVAGTSSSLARVSFVTSGGGIAGLTLNGNSGAKASNYTLAGGITITPYVLSFSGTRVYDGTNKVNAGNLLDATTGSATLGSSTFSGVGTDTFILSGTGSLGSANAGHYGGTASGTGGTPSGTAQVGVGGLTLVPISGISNNYTLVGGNDTYDIDAKLVTITGERVYDGVTDANGLQAGTRWVVNGVTGGDQSNVSVAGNGSVSSANIGTYGDSGTTGGNVFASNVGSGGLSLGGSEASNYTLATTGNTFTITPYVVNLSGDRTYNGSISVDVGTGNFTSNGSSNVATNGNFTGVNGETLTLAGPYSLGSLTNTNGTTGGNAGTNMTSYNAANANGLSLSGATASNYIIGSVGYTVNQAVINLTGTRVYDGTTNIYNDGTSGSSFATVTGLNGDTFTLNGEGSTLGKDVNGGAPYTGTGSTTGTAQGFNLNTLGLVGVGSANAGNYTLVGGTDSYTLTPATLTVVGTTVNTKTYDGTTAATLSNAALSGVLGSDHVTLGNDTGGTFVTPNAGTNIGVTAGTMTIGGGNAGDYTLVQPTGLTGTINPMVLNLTGTRVYDGTMNIYSDGTSGSSFATVTGLNGDTFTLNGEGSTLGKDVNGGAPYTGTGSTTGTAQGFNLNTLGLVGVGSANAGNYTLVGGTDSYTLTPATLTVVGTTVNTKTYDGTTAATLSNAALSGVLGSDQVTLGNDTGGTFVTPNAGTNIGVAAGTMTIGGGNAGDYTLVQPTGLTGTINPMVLNLTGTRVYNGNTDAAASLFGNNGVLTGVNGETLTLGGIGTLATKNVGTQQPFASNGLSGFTLAGNGSTLAGNYTLTGGTDWLTITPLAITVDATGKDKTYDGTTTATAALDSSGVLAGDTVSFSDGSANFNSPNASTGVPISVTGITASGTDAGNYSFNTTASTRATINPYALDLTGMRVYDMTTGAYGSDFGTVAGLDGDTFTVSGTGLVSSKNVGSYNGVGGSSFGLGNLALVSGGSALAGNYTLVGGTDQYTIMPATLTVAGTTVGTKTYDGTTTASLSGSTLTGVLGSDSVALGNDTTGTFASANAGTEGVATGMTIGGTDAGNYIIVQPSGLVGTIAPYVLDLSGTRVYDGTTNAIASAFGNGGLLTGIHGETVNLGGTGQVGDKNVGSDKLFTSLGSLTLSDGSNGGLAGNYTLVGGVDTLSITPKTLVADATGTSKIYNGNTLDTVTLGSPGVVVGDSVQFGYGTANFSDPTIGSNKRVTVTSVQLSGADAGNYLLASPTVYTLANITGAQASAFGISNGTLAGVDSVLNSKVLATPYGLAAQDSVGTFIGNKKRLHRPVERNVSRGDFSSGLALKVIDGGVRPPAQALP